MSNCIPWDVTEGFWLMFGYELLAEALLAGGVERVFGVMGEGNLRYIAAFSRRGDYVAAVDEGGAVGMADGSSRFSKGVGVAAITHGPALTNCLTALTEAVRAHSRLVLVTSSHPPGRRHLQRFDLAAAVALTGATYRKVLDPARIGDAVFDALRTCLGGPVVLDVPVEVQVAEGGDLRIPTFGHTDAVELMGDDDVLDVALGLLVSARHPLILAGRGAISARSSLVELAAATGAWLGTTVLGKDLFRNVPGNLGIVGTVSTQNALSAISSIDCVAAFGTSLDSFTTMNGALLTNHRVIRCDIREESLGDWPVDVAILGDADPVARSMVAALRSAGFDTGPAPRLDRSVPVPKAHSEGLELHSVVATLDRMLPENRIVVTDTGRFKGPVWQGLRVRGPEFFSHTIGFGALGLGLACSVGAAISGSAELTVCVSGDGGFMMGCTELATAARLRLPLVVVVLNDMAYGAEFSALRNLGLDSELARLTWPPMAEIGAAFGARARRVTDIGELKAAAVWVEKERQSGFPGPYLIEVVLDAASIEI